jgi:hypothetical protein
VIFLHLGNIGCEGIEFRARMIEAEGPLGSLVDKGERITNVRFVTESRHSFPCPLSARSAIL